MKFLKSKWVWAALGVIAALAFSDKLLPHWDKLTAKLKGGTQPNEGGNKI